MTGFDRFILILSAVIAYGAYKNAAEAHRHTHELACHVDAEDLCLFHKVHP